MNKLHDRCFTRSYKVENSRLKLRMYKILDYLSIIYFAVNFFLAIFYAIKDSLNGWIY
jgi:hypothetical protein